MDFMHIIQMMSTEGDSESIDEHKPEQMLFFGFQLKWTLYQNLKPPRCISLPSVRKTVASVKRKSTVTVTVHLRTCWAMDTCKWEEVDYFSCGRYNSVGGIISIRGWGSGGSWSLMHY